MSQRTVERLDVSAAEVADLLERLSLWARRAAPATMSSTSFTTLDSLAHTGPQRVTDLAAQQGVAQPSMTALVNRLGQEGYAERLPHPRDGRSSLVGITTEGRRALARRHAERARALQRVITDLPDHQQRALQELVGPLRGLTELTTTDTTYRATNRATDRTTEESTHR